MSNKCIIFVTAEGQWTYRCVLLQITFLIHLYSVIFHITQLMAMIIWTKKKFKQIYRYRTKGTYCGYMGDHKEIKKQHSF